MTFIKIYNVLVKKPMYDIIQPIISQILSTNENIFMLVPFVPIISMLHVSYIGIKLGKLIHETLFILINFIYKLNTIFVQFNNDEETDVSLIRFKVDSKIYHIKIINGKLSIIKY